MKRYITRIHLWAGLQLGLQVVIWMSSGVVMSWFDIEAVTGRDRASPKSRLSLKADELGTDFATILQNFPDTNQIEFRRIGEVAVLEITDVLGEVHLLEASSGEPIIVGETEAISTALDDYAGEALVKRVMLVEDPHYEIRGNTLPLWRVDIDDERGTRLYVSPDDARIAARRNDTWRLYDFFWMLHIMDYDERNDFNNPLIRTASATGLIFALSGLGLVILRLGSRRYQNEARRLATFVRRAGK